MNRMVNIFLLQSLLGLATTVKADVVLPNVQPNIPRPETLRPEVTPAIPTEKSPDTPKIKKSPIRVVVGEFRFDGNKHFTSQELSSLLKDFTGHEIGMHELNEAMGIVRTHYKNNGYMLAQIFLPPQDLKKPEDTQATVEFKILEGSLSQVTVKPTEEVNTSIMQGLAEYGLNKGDTLRERNLVRNIMVLNGLPGVTATSALNPGDEIGSSNVEIEVSPKPKVVGYARLNSYGNPYTGREVASFGVAFNNLTGAGDQLSFFGRSAIDAKQRGLGASYIRPVTNAGSMLSLNYNYVDYRLGGVFDDLRAHGNGHYFSAAVDHPLIRDTKTGLYFKFGANYKVLDDDIDLYPINNRRDIYSADIGFSGDWMNAAGNVVYQWSALITPGHVSFKSLDATTFFLTKDHFLKWDLNTTRTQYFENGLNWILRLDYQGTNQNLDIAERFGIGAINRWRGFAELPTQADEGWMSSNELRKTIAVNKPSPDNNTNQNKWLNSVTTFAFYDVGSGRLNHDPQGRNNHVWSSHFGAGLDLQYINQWTLSVTFSEQKQDVDGSPTNTEYRWWGQLAKSF